MKFSWILSFFLSAHVLAQSVYERGTYVPPPSVYGLKELNQVLFNENQTQERDLKKVKYLLINGELDAAQAILTQLALAPSKLRPIAFRYAGIIAFLRQDYLRAYTFFNRPEVNATPQYSKVCVAKVLNLIILNRTLEMEYEWSRCQQENPGHLRESHLAWLSTLIELKLNPESKNWRTPYRRYSLASFMNEDLKTFLKLGLFLKQEELLSKKLVDLTVDQLEDPEIRELAAQIFYRSGSLVDSYHFIEGLSSPNAEVIKGNLYLLRKKYEVAYAQFRLALEQKQNSQNALERLIPLAWLLGDWENGASFVERMMASPNIEANKLTLAAAFYMQKGDYERTNFLIETINKTSRQGKEKDAAQIGSFVGLMLNDARAVDRNGLASCQQYDLVNCWTIYQMQQWDSFPLTLRRDEAIFKDEVYWNKIKDEESTPLKETVYINQIDIEELDDKLYGTHSRGP